MEFSSILNFSTLLLDMKCLIKCTEEILTKQMSIYIKNVKHTKKKTLKETRCKYNAKSATDFTDDIDLLSWTHVRSIVASMHKTIDCFVNGKFDDLFHYGFNVCIRFTLYSYTNCVLCVFFVLTFVRHAGFILVIQHLTTKRPLLLIHWISFVHFVSLSSFNFFTVKEN